MEKVSKFQQVKHYRKIKVKIRKKNIKGRLQRKIVRQEKWQRGEGKQEEIKLEKIWNNGRKNKEMKNKNEIMKGRKKVIDERIQ